MTSNGICKARRSARWSMAARCATALAGGYLAAAGLASLLARVLPAGRAEATAWGMILSFLFFACIALWAFHEHRLRRVIIAIWGSGLTTTALVVLMGPRP